MAVDINSLVRTIGGQKKVIDKDKAIIDLANEVANGGGGQTKRIVACWKVISENEFEEINKKDEETFEINSFTNKNQMFLFTTDENEPNDTFENVVLSVNPQNPYNISIINLGVITAIQSESVKDENNNLVIPDTLIGVFDNSPFAMESQPYLTIDIKYTESV